MTTGVVLGRQVFGQVGTLQNRHLLPAGGIAKTNQTKVGVAGILVSVGPGNCCQLAKVYSRTDPRIPGKLSETM